MPDITILLTFPVLDVDGSTTRTAYIEIAEGQEAYYYAVPDIPLGADVQTVLEARAAELWAAAQARGETADPLSRIDLLQTQVIKALALVLLDEINLLREAIVFFHPGAASELPQRTVDQLKTVIRQRMKDL